MSEFTSTLFSIKVEEVQTMWSTPLLELLLNLYEKVELYGIIEIGILF
jgi:hypothetical protein